MSTFHFTIHDILFGNPQSSTSFNLESEPNTDRKKLNQLCDSQGIWCHIQYGNDVFLTTDRNFTKVTKLPKLIALGAKRICHPGELG
jgi:hypothetical protein